jgi:hypothetical protein
MDSTLNFELCLLAYNSRSLNRKKVYSTRLW